MIVVTGTVFARPDSLDEVLHLGTEHVLRSRGEPGCISHQLMRDTEEPLRLHFLERWSDMDALHAHFAVEGSRAFVKRLSALVAEPPSLQMYDATELTQ